MTTDDDQSRTTQGFWAGHKSLEGKPLNGEKTHPLTAHARGVLRELARAPLPRQKINPGVADRFERGGLAEEVMLPSPFHIHRGAPIRHLKITAAGLEETAMASAQTTRQPAEVFHPSGFIIEEMEARGWTRDDLAVRMGGDPAVNRLALDLYFEVGPANPSLLLGPCDDLERAFGVPAQFFLNLEAAWRRGQVQ